MKPQLNCLFCQNGIDKHVVTDKNVVQVHQEIFVKLCHSLQIENKGNTCEFKENIFPFCNLCKNDIARLVKYRDQICELEKNIQKLVIKFTTLTIESHLEGKRRYSGYENNYGNFRRKLVERYRPNIKLPQFKSVVSVPCVPDTEKHLSGSPVCEKRGVCFLNSAATSLAVKSSTSMNSPSTSKGHYKKHESYSKDHKNHISTGSNNIQGGRFTRQKTKLVTKARKVYRTQGFRFATTNEGHLCLTCGVIIKIPILRGKRINFTKIKNHIRITHKDKIFPITASNNDRQICTEGLYRTHREFSHNQNSSQVCSKDSKSKKRLRGQPVMSVSKSHNENDWTSCITETVQNCDVETRTVEYHFLCEKCGEMFEIEQHLDTHLPTHDYLFRKAMDDFINSL